MPIVTTRRLKVRDDGAGNSGLKDSSLDDFLQEDAIVVLGNPGMGKTTLFKSVPNSSFSTIRRFLAAPTAAAEPLFLDALDEYRTLAEGQDVALRLSEALQSLGRPRFRISCRAADWFGSSDLEVLRDASASGRVVVLELLPLTHEEIVAAVEGEIADPATFFAETEAAGVSDLLSNPQTLELIVKAWRGANKPQNKYQAYDFGVQQLIREMNPIHAGHVPATINPQALRAAAAATASTVLLSNISGVSRNEAAATDEYVHISTVPHPKLPEMEESVERRVFESPDVHQFELAHRTIAEFLAAEDLVERVRQGLPIDRVFALICGSDGKPVASLRGLFAWLISKDAALASSYLDLDAYAVATYGDCEVLSPQAQRSLLTSLSKLDDPWFLSNESDRTSFRGLANEDTKETILEVLKDANAGAHAKITMLEAIANTPNSIPDFEHVTQQLVINKEGGTWLRTVATRAYMRSTGRDVPKLEALDDALSASDNDDEAGDVRVALLRDAPEIGDRSRRVLSIIEQVSKQGKKSGGRGRRIIGRLYALSSIVHDSELDDVLNGMSPVLSDDGPDEIEFGAVFDTLLSRRFNTGLAIQAAQLVRWMETLSRHRRSSSEKVRNEIAELFRKNAKLLDEVFDSVFDLSRAPILRPRPHFVNLWQVVPPPVWPIDPARYLLGRASMEGNTARAAALMREYISMIPPDSAHVELAEKGFEFLEGDVPLFVENRLAGVLSF
jgi:hypothetical protein